MDIDKLIPGTGGRHNGRSFSFLMDIDKLMFLYCDINVECKYRIIPCRMCLLHTFGRGLLWFRYLVVYDFCAPWVLFANRMTHAIAKTIPIGYVMEGSIFRPSGAWSIYVEVTAAMKVAGIAGIRNIFLPGNFWKRYTEPVQSTIMAKVWLVQEKYLQIMLKSIWDRMPPTVRRGTANIRRLAAAVWGTLNQSARVRRAERKAVSPEVRGHAITPSIARAAPT